MLDPDTKDIVQWKDWVSRSTPISEKGENGSTVLTDAKMTTPEKTLCLHWKACWVSPKNHLFVSANLHNTSNVKLSVSSAWSQTCMTMKLYVDYVENYSGAGRSKRSTLEDHTDKLHSTQGYFIWGEEDLNALLLAQASIADRFVALGRDEIDTRAHKSETASRASWTLKHIIIYTYVHCPDYKR